MDIKRLPYALSSLCNQNDRDVTMRLRNSDELLIRHENRMSDLWVDFSRMIGSSNQPILR